MRDAARLCSQRRLDLDALKVAGMMLVASYHYGVFPYSAESGLIALVFRALESCCVPVFFFAGGVVLSRKRYGLKSCLRRALKLMLLTFFWATVFWPVNSVVEGGRLPPFGLGEWLSGVLTLEMHVVNWLWFLPAFACLYLALPFLQLVRDADARAFKALVFGLVITTLGLSSFERFGVLMTEALGSQIPVKLAGFVRLFCPLAGGFGGRLSLFAAGMLAADSACRPSRSVWLGLIAAGVLGPTLYSLAMGALLVPSDPYAASSSLSVLALCVGLYVLFGNLQRLASGGGSFEGRLGSSAQTPWLYIFSTRHFRRPFAAICRPFRTRSMLLLGRALCSARYLHRPLSALCCRALNWANGFFRFRRVALASCTELPVVPIQSPSQEGLSLLFVTSIFQCAVFAERAMTPRGWFTSP